MAVKFYIIVVVVFIVVRFKNVSDGLGGIYVLQAELVFFVTVGVAEIITQQFGRRFIEQIVNAVYVVVAAQLVSD